MRTIAFQRGATSWGFQMGKLWLTWPYLEFLRLGCRPKMGWDNDEGGV